MFNQDWQTLQNLIAANELDSAEDLVKKMHQNHHKQAFMHARIHFTWSRIARLKQAYLWAFGQWITAAIFAIPVSILQTFFSKT